jgi:hypothetical protein
MPRHGQKAVTKNKGRQNLAALSCRYCACSGTDSDRALPIDQRLAAIACAHRDGELVAIADP